MKRYEELLMRIKKDLINEKIYLRDYIRVKRFVEYDEKIMREHGAMVLLIEDYKYDYQIIRMEDKDKYELINVSNMIYEIKNVTLYFR